METILESIAKGSRTPTSSPIPISANGGRAAASALTGLLGSDAAAVGAAAGLALAAGPLGAPAGLPHAASFIDCESVLRQASIANPNKPKPAPVAAISGPRASELLQGGPVTAVQEDEDQMAQVGWFGRGRLGYCFLWFVMWLHSALF